MLSMATGSFRCGSIRPSVDDPRHQLTVRAELEPAASS
jgi:hypothetical protein